MSTQPLPVARTAPPARHVWWAWLAPLVAVALVGFLLWHSVMQKGPTVTIAFENGEGIAEGDPVTYRGVRVGTVKAVLLAEDLHGVRVRAELEPDAAGLAAEGTTFWIVRPEVTLRRVSGLETLLGPRYIGVLPGPKGDGHAEPVLEFVGVSRVPTNTRLIEGDDGGLEVTLVSDRASSIAAGSPVTYRDVRVGVVSGVSLSADGRDVLVSATVYPEFAHLVRTNTRFWNAGGFGIDLGLMGGLKVKADSLESVLAGGVAFATPTRAGETIEPGHRFVLEDAAEDEWLEWRPDLAAPNTTP